MLSRREFLMASAALSAIAGPDLVGRWSRAAAQQALTEDTLLDFEPVGNVTLVHITDIHAQLVPVYYREPSINLGVGDVGNSLVEEESFRVVGRLDFPIGHHGIAKKGLDIMAHRGVVRLSRGEWIPQFQHCLPGVVRKPRL